MTKATNPSDTRQSDAVKALRKALQDKLGGTDLKAGVTGSAAQALDAQESSSKGLAVVSKAFDLKTDSSVSAILVVVLYGVGTDYILFLMFRYRERLRTGEDPKSAMVSAVTRVGEAITSATSAVIIAFMALTLSTLGMFRSLGPALATFASMMLAGNTTLSTCRSGDAVHHPNTGSRRSNVHGTNVAAGTRRLPHSRESGQSG